VRAERGPDAGCRSRAAQRAWLRPAWSAALVAVLATAATQPLAASDREAVLRVGITELPASLGDPFRGNGRPGTFTWYSLFDGLTQLDESGRLVPSLALGWNAIGDRTWRFTLRPAVRFADGTPFDATSVVAVIDWLRSPEGRRSVVGNELRAVTGARAVGPLTVEIDTARPDPILPNRMVSVLIVEPGAWRRLGPAGFARAPIGTGPFLLERWDAAERRAYARANPHSWRRNAHAGIVFVELPDASVRTQALLSRDVDVTPIEVEELDRLEKRGIPYTYATAMAVSSIAFVTEGRPGSLLRDRRVRQALNYAVDRDAIARHLLRGLVRPSSQPAPSGSFGHDPALPAYPYDPARARAMLAAAGYPRGFPLQVEIKINAFSADSLIFQAVAHYLRQVGVETTLRSITFPDYLSKLQRNAWDGDAYGAAWNNAPWNDATRPMETFSCKRPNAFFCDPSLVEKLDRASGLLDPEARRAALQALAADYKSAAPALFLVEQIDFYGYQPGLEGVRIRNRVPVFEEIRRRSPPRKPR
jgi:peptide/nickel transport system substrate-binding protein